MEHTRKNSSLISSPVSPDKTVAFSGAFRSAAQGKTLFASFSGGADSTALVLALAKEKIPFSAVHFTHGIRSAACGVRECAFCADFCRGLGIPFLHESLDVPRNRRPGEGVEEAARRLRLEAWKRILPENGAVVTAHHAGDAAETVLLRLFRGGNVSSLAGLRERVRVEGILFLRPLLAYSKEELLAFLKANGVTGWMEDETNRETGYLRNFFRNRILPEVAEKIPFAFRALQSSAEALRLDAEYLEDHVSGLYEKGDPADPAFWRGLHPAVSIRLLRRFLSEQTGRDVIPDRHLLARFEELLRKERTGFRLEIPGTDRILTLSRGRLRLAEPPPDTEDVTWNYRKTPEIRFGRFLFFARFADRRVENDSCITAYFDAAALPSVLHITLRREGDRMIPFGTHSPRKLKKILTDAHLAAAEKACLPVLRADGEILWVPGVKRSSLAPCVENTKEVLIVEARENF